MPGELIIHYGNPGSGKTLFAMKEVILPAVKENRPFFTNITGISVNALSALTGVHQIFIKYYPVNDVHDVINYFDDEKLSHDGVFVLDEMKDFIDNEKAVSWLESCLNLMRKHSVDFVLIAQQPKKEYIHPNILGLANGSNVFKTRKRKGDTIYVDKYFVNSGTPKIVGDEVANAVDKVVKKKPVEMYNCYTTSESKFYSASEDKTFFGRKWYQETKWKGRFFFAFCVVLALIGGVYAVFSLLGFQDKVGVKNEVKKSISSVSSVQTPTVPKSDFPTCYSWKICTEKMCETDIGNFSPSLLIDNIFSFASYSFPPCQGNNELSSRRRLLRPGEEVSNGTGSGLFNFSRN